MIRASDSTFRVELWRVINVDLTFNLDVGLLRCVRIQLALPAFGKQNRPTIHVLDCSLADVDEVARLSSK
jgi:hypothetical protein